jgi:hypothetical protein
MDCDTGSVAENIITISVLGRKLSDDKCVSKIKRTACIVSFVSILLYCAGAGHLHGGEQQLWPADGQPA